MLYVYYLHKLLNQTLKKNPKRETLYIKKSDDLAYESDYNWTEKNHLNPNINITSIFDFISNYDMIWSVFKYRVTAFNDDEG